MPRLPAPAPIKIHPVRTPIDLADAITLFRAYAAHLAIDLSFQDFETEMASMPGRYAPPRGELLLARDASSGEPLGCVGLRALDVTEEGDGEEDVGGCVDGEKESRGGDRIEHVIEKRRRNESEKWDETQPLFEGKHASSQDLTRTSHRVEEYKPNFADSTSQQKSHSVISSTCEMKRLYVVPGGRGRCIGEKLVDEIIHEATTRHYTEMKLDTLSTMGAAICLYQRKGFVDIEPYCVNPIPGVRFLGLRLGEAQGENADTAKT